MIFFMLVSKTATTAEACLPTLSIPNDSRYSTKAFLIFSMRQSLNCTIHHYLFEEKHMYKDPLNSKKQMKYLLYPSCRRISLAPNRPNLKPACGGPLDRKADSILPNGLRQHTILYEIRRLLKSFSQIKN